MRSKYIDALQKLMPASEQQNTEISKIEKTLLKGRFKLGRVVYVERKEKSGNAIFAKAFDFSSDTITQLIWENCSSNPTGYTTIKFESKI